MSRCSRQRGEEPRGAEPCLIFPSGEPLPARARSNRLQHPGAARGNYPPELLLHKYAPRSFWPLFTFCCRERRKRHCCWQRTQTLSTRPIRNSRIWAKLKIKGHCTMCRGGPWRPRPLVPEAPPP